MKKSLSVVLSTAMAVSVFASAAFAETAPATTTTGTTATATAVKTSADFKDLAGIDAALKAKIDAMLAKGYFEGVSADSFGINENMTRAQFAKILVLVAGVKVDESVKTSSFADVKADDAANSWAIPFIEAAKKAGLVDGKSNTSYDPGAKVTLGELATALVKATGGKVDTTGTPWYADAVKQAVALKVLPEGTDGSKFAMRSDLVVSAAGAVAVLADVNKPAVDIKAVGAKKVEVTFNKAVDTTKATFKVTRGSVEQNVDNVSWNDAKTVATVTMTVKFQKDDYTVAVGGVVDPAVTKTLSLEQEKIVKIDFPTDKASFVRGDAKSIETSYNVYNQYNEKVNDTAVTFNASKGNATGSKGALTVTTVSYGNADYTLNENVIVSGYYSDYTTGSFAQAQKTLTVSPEAKVASLEIEKLHHASNKTPKVGETPSSYLVKFKAKDQYGNAVTKAADVKSDIQVFASNPYLFTVSNVFTSSDGYIFVELAPATGKTTFDVAGTSTVTMYAINSGASAKLDVTVADSQKVGEFSLTAPDVAVGGEEITIPYTAADKDGKVLGTAADYTLLSGITVSSNIGSVKWVQDVVNNKTKLVLDVKSITVTKNNPQPAFINAAVNPNSVDYKLVNLNLTLKENAIPDAITGLADTKLAMVDMASTTVEHDDIKVVDQYNRSYAIKDNLTKYNVAVELDADTYVKQTNVTAATTKKDVITDTSKKATLEAVKKGSAKLTLTLIDVTTGKAFGSSKTFTMNIVEPKDVVDYEIGDVATLYAYDASALPEIYGNAGDYSKSLSVTGLLADGTKVGIKTDDARLYTVTGATYDVTYSAGKLTANASIKTNLLKGDTETAKGKVYVKAIKGQTDEATFEKELNISKAAPVATKFEVQSSGIATKEGTDFVSVKSRGFTKATLAVDAAKVVDQYGVTINNGTKFTNVVLSNLKNLKNEVKKASGTVITGDAILSNIDTGDTFTVTVTAKNGTQYAFKVVVKEVPTP